MANNLMEEDPAPGADVAPEDIGYDPGMGIQAPPGFSAPTTSESFLPNPLQPAPAVLPPSQGGPIPTRGWEQQPPASSQPQGFSATPFIRDVFERGIGGTKEAQAAITQALQLEGILGFDADRKAGVPVAEAMAKWAPKMYATHPNVAIDALRHQAPPFVPTKLNVAGQDMFMMGPGHAQFAPKQASEGLKQSDRMHGLVAEAARLKDAIASEDNQAQEQEYRKQYKEVLGELHKLTTPQGAGSASGGVRVRDKKTGKTFRYMGDAAHVPTDQYDILK